MGDSTIINLRALTFRLNQSLKMAHATIEREVPDDKKDALEMLQALNDIHDSNRWLLLLDRRLKETLERAWSNPESAAPNLLKALETITLEAMMANLEGRPVDQEKIDEAHEVIKMARGEV